MAKHSPEGNASLKLVAGSSAAVAYIWCGNDAASSRLHLFTWRSGSVISDVGMPRYYLSRACKTPSLYFKDGPLSRIILQHCPILQKPFAPTPWAFNGHAQTLLSGALLVINIQHHPARNSTQACFSQSDVSRTHARRRVVASRTNTVQSGKMSAFLGALKAVQTPSPDVSHPAVGRQFWRDSDYRRQALITPDGGLIALDWYHGSDTLPELDQYTPILMVFHGLTGACALPCHTDHASQ